MDKRQLLRFERRGDEVFLVGSWERVTGFDPSLLGYAGAHLRGTLHLTVANGSAEYEITGWNPATQTIEARLQDHTEEPT